MGKIVEVSGHAKSHGKLSGVFFSLLSVTVTLSAFAFFIVSLLKSQSAFVTASTIKCL